MHTNDEIIADIEMQITRIPKFFKSYNNWIMFMSFCWFCTIPYTDTNALKYTLYSNTKIHNSRHQPPTF